VSYRPPDPTKPDTGETEMQGPSNRPVPGPEPARFSQRNFALFVLAVVVIVVAIWLIAR
jgi:hypothetical protein